MECHRILVSALFLDMSSLLTIFISKNYFYFHLFLRYIFLNVALVMVVVVAVAVVEAAVGSVELQRERLTVRCVELQRG